jgi:hypothetical protein
MVTETSELKTQTPGKFPEESTLKVENFSMNKGESEVTLLETEINC